VGRLVILGRFPPPLDGQAIQTDRLASLLETGRSVTRVDISAPEGELARAEARFRTGRLWHYLRRGPAIRAALRPHDTVLWTSISGSALGHVRDVLTVNPAFRPGHRVFGVVHRGDFASLYQHPATRATATHLTRRLEGLVFLSEALARQCAPWVPEHKRYVIPNTLDEAGSALRERASAKADRGPHAPLRLLFLSNMIASKGFADVLSAVATLHARGVPVQADFAGRWTSEADREAFARFTEAHGLGASVRHHGGVSRERAQELHLAANVFLLPTYYPTEAQPATLIEALAAGTPVVVTPHASLPEMVRAGREAEFVPPRDPQAIADAVLRLAGADRWREASTAARARYEAVFAPEPVLARWESLIRGDPPGRIP
jgi:glycosyltransferase involved in cell wall biosynthesis